jgi:MFS family permease
MKSIAAALQSLVVTLWVGGMWVAGFVVAPLLFARLADRELAGIIAGKLFTTIALIGLACALYLVTYRVARFGAGALKQGFFWVVLAMLALTLIGEFGIQPVLAGLKAEALPKKVMESVLRDRFATWHGIASGIFVIQSGLGALLAILLGRGK